MKLFKTKKGEAMSGAVWTIVGVAVAFVVVALVVGFGSMILGDTQTDMVTNTYHCGLNSTNGTGGSLLYDNCGAAYNNTGSGLTAVGKLSSKLPLIGTVIVAVIIIGLLVAGFAGFMHSRQH